MGGARLPVQARSRGGVLPLGSTRLPGDVLPWAGLGCSVPPARNKRCGAAYHQWAALRCPAQPAWNERRGGRRIANGQR